MERPGMAPMAPPVDSSLAWGTVGWQNDGGVFYQLGDGSATDTGRTLVRVTLFRGRAPNVALDQTQAQGTELLCQLDSSFFRLPAKGTPVLVAIPEPHGNVPGASIILASSGIGSPVVGNMKEDELCIGIPGSAARILIKKNGTIALMTTDDNTPTGKTCALILGPDGFSVMHPKGALSIDAQGVTLSSGAAAVTLTPAGVGKLLGTQVAMQGTIAAIAGQLFTCVGPNAIPIGPPGAPSLLSAVHGMSGLTGIASSNVLISP